MIQEYFSWVKIKLHVDFQPTSWLVLWIEINRYWPLCCAGPASLTRAGISCRGIIGRHLNLKGSLVATMVWKDGASLCSWVVSEGGRGFEVQNNLFETP